MLTLPSGRLMQLALAKSVRASSARNVLPVPAEIAAEVSTLADPMTDPTSVPALDAYQPAVSLFQLDSEDAWQDFDVRMRLGHAGNIGPWRRLLSVVRSQGARTCVVESNYVCLDYRSEMATFYSQLDARPSSKSVRLHFFACDVPADKVFSLADEHRQDYLGYVVCRSGRLPLVARSVVKAPPYITTSAAIDEPVYFFGQRLTVTGVPFMQQDQRFAICAQVVAWETNYSAYRRGLVERRLIADFVLPGTPFHPMRPATQVGLLPDQVAQLIHDSGMRADVWTTPLGNEEADYPPLSLQDYPEFAPSVASIRAVFEELQGTGAPTTSSIEGDTRQGGLAPHLPELLASVRNPDSNLVSFLNDTFRVARETGGDTPLFKLASELHDKILWRLAEPFIASRWPIYCATADHALLMCGLGRSSNGSPLFFFHDDQQGPYLASRFALHASKGDFMYQNGQIDKDGASQPSHGVLAEDLAGPVASGAVGFDWTGLAIRNLVLPSPARLLLSPSAAVAAAIELVKEEPDWGCDEVRARLVLGTDYKDDRIAQAIAAKDPAARAFFASAHVAEWSIAVEGLQAGKVRWEVAFDASSGDTYPLAQIARYDREVAYVASGSERVTSVHTVRTKTFQPMVVNSRLGKGKFNDE